MTPGRLLCIFAAGCLVPTAALAQCPALTNADPTYVSAGAGCNALITINANGSVSISTPNLNPYDGVEDQYVGVVNNSSTPLTSLTLSGAPDIFGFDGDGIDTFGIAGNNRDNTGYGGPNAYFTAIDQVNFAFGTVNFINAIAGNGGTGFFSLELDPRSGTFGVTGTNGGPNSATPEPSSLILLGTGVAGMAASLRRKLFA